MPLMLSGCGSSSTELTFNEVSESEETDTEADEDSESESEDETESETATESAGTANLSEDTEGSDICYVYVCGAVNTPGVYELEPGSRAYEAIELAGGTTDDAASTAINLAEEVYDGEQLYVPTWDEYNNGWEPESTTAATDTEVGAADDTDSVSALVNINTATKDELMTLSGIGESKAEAIISYREENGDFSQIEDIMLVSGIKEAAYEKIKDYITVD